MKSRAAVKTEKPAKARAALRDRISANKGKARKVPGSGRMKRVITPWLFLAPSLAGVTIFHGLPFVDVVKRSFQDAMGTRYVGLKNYQAVLGNTAFRMAVSNTTRFLLVCLPLLMLISFGIAVLLTAGAARRARQEPPTAARGKRQEPPAAARGRRREALETVRRRRTDPGRKQASSGTVRGEKQGSSGAEEGPYGIFRTTLVLPMAVPAASMVLVWKIFLCPEGVLNQWLTRLTGQMWQEDWAFSRWAFPVLVFTYLWKHTGYDMVLWLAGLQAVPGELYEAARIDGAGAWARLWYITLPEIRGTFVLAGILSLVNSFQVYREAYLLAGAYPDTSIYLLPHLFAHWFLSLDIQKMTAAAVLLTGVLMLPALPGWLWGRRKHKQSA